MGAQVSYELLGRGWWEQSLETVSLGLKSRGVLPEKWFRARNSRSPVPPPIQSNCCLIDREEI